MSALRIQATLKSGEVSVLWTEWPTDASIGSLIGTSAQRIEGRTDAGLPAAIVVSEVAALQVIDKASELPAQGERTQRVALPPVLLGQLPRAERERLLTKLAADGDELWRVNGSGASPCDMIVPEGTFDNDRVWGASEVVDGVGMSGEPLVVKRSEIALRRKLFPQAKVSN